MPQAGSDTHDGAERGESDAEVIGPRLRPPLAAVAIFAAMCASAFVAAADWPVAVQRLEFPFVGQIPDRLAGVFAAVALGDVLVSAIVGTLLVPAVVSSGRGSLMLGITLLGASASVWDGLYLTAVRDPIPVLEWLFYALPVVMITLAAPKRSGGRLDIVTAALLAVVPVAGVSTLGWGIQGDPGTGLVIVFLSGVPGVSVGLIPVLARSGRPSINNP